MSDLISAGIDAHNAYKKSLKEVSVNNTENNTETLIFRLRERARIRRQIKTRKSVQEGKPDRIANLLEEAANEIEELNKLIGAYKVSDYPRSNY